MPYALFRQYCGLVLATSLLLAATGTTPATPANITPASTTAAEIGSNADPAVIPPEEESRSPRRRP